MTRAIAGPAFALALAAAVPAAAAPAADLERARELSWKGAYDDSIAIYRELLAGEPGDVALHRELGNVMLWAGRYEQALESLERVIEAEPLDRDARLAAGRAHWYLGRPRDALGHYLLALDGDEVDPASIAEVVPVMRAAERGELAERWLARGLALAPDDPALRAVRAELLRERGELDAAERELRAIVAAHPDDAAARERLESLRREREDPVALARRLGNDGRLEQARRLLAARLSEAPGDTEARRLAARFAGWAGDYGASLSDYRRLLARSPDDRGLRAELAGVLSWTGRYAEARRIYESLVAEDAGDLDARLGIANVFLWSERERSAERELREILAIDSAHAGAQRQMRRLRQRRAPTLEPALGYFEDSDGFELFHPETRATVSPRSGRRLWLSIDAPRARGLARAGDDPATGLPRFEDERVDGQGLRFGWRERPEGSLAYAFELGAVRYDGGSSSPRARAAISWRPREGHVLELDLRHGDALPEVRSIESAREDVERSSLYLVHSYRGERLDTWTRLELDRYSDDAKSWAGRTVVGYQLFGWPLAVDVLLLASASDFDRFSPLYYSPQDETSYAAGLRLSKRLWDRVDLLLIGELGRMRNREGSGDRLRLAPELRLELSERLELSLRFERFESIRSQRYTSDFARALVRYRFPVEP